MPVFQIVVFYGETKYTVERELQIIWAMLYGSVELASRSKVADVLTRDESGCWIDMIGSLIW